MDRCEKCGALLSKDSGFSNLCDLCEGPAEIEVIGAPEISRAREIIAPPKEAHVPPTAPRKRRTAVKSVPTVVAQRVCDEFHFDPDTATRDELLDMKSRVISKIAELTASLSKPTPSKNRDAIGLELKALGATDQSIAMALGKLRGIRQKLASSDSSIIERVNDKCKFHNMFFQAAKFVLTQGQFDAVMGCVELKMQNPEQQTPTASL